MTQKTTFEVLKHFSTVVLGQYITSGKTVCYECRSRSENGKQYFERTTCPNVANGLYDHAVKALEN